MYTLMCTSSWMHRKNNIVQQFSLFTWLYWIRNVMQLLKFQLRSYLTRKKSSLTFVTTEHWIPIVQLMTITSRVSGNNFWKTFFNYSFKHDWYCITYPKRWLMICPLSLTILSVFQFSFCIVAELSYSHKLVGYIWNFSSCTWLDKGLPYVPFVEECHLKFGQK